MTDTLPFPCTYNSGCNNAENCQRVGHCTSADKETLDIMDGVKPILALDVEASAALAADAEAAAAGYPVDRNYRACQHCAGIEVDGIVLHSWSCTRPLKDGYEPSEDQVAER